VPSSAIDSVHAAFERPVGKTSAAAARLLAVLGTRWASSGESAAAEVQVFVPWVKEPARGLV